MSTCHYRRNGPPLPTVPLARPRVLALLLLTGSAGAGAQTPWTDPHPLRLEAVTEGRDFTYGREAFLHRFGYRHLSGAPAPGEDGLWGTGGSVSGDELYVDINLQKTLMMDNGRLGVVARMQRREDFDGRFDRQLVGLTGRLGGDWEVAVLADATGDKGRADFQYEAAWRPEAGRFLRLALIQPDLLYNDKSQSDNEYTENPFTAFMHYRQPWLDGGHLETAVNYTPRLEYEERGAGYSIDADQLRVMAAASLPVTGGWYSGLRVELEHSNRDFAALDLLDEGANGDPGEDAALGVPGEDFRRRALHVIWSVEAPEHPWSPRLGLRWQRLDEEGWFGTGLGTSGFNDWREAGAFAGITWRTGERHWWEPAVHLAQVDYERRYLQREEDSRQRDEFLAKLNLPWRYVVHEESGAVLTLNTTFRLHSLAFGGGNIQLHWPF